LALEAEKSENEGLHLARAVMLHCDAVGEGITWLESCARERRARG
jgi:hypothetical protein